MLRREPAEHRTQRRNKEETGRMGKYGAQQKNMEQLQDIRKNACYVLQTEKQEVNHAPEQHAHGNM